MSPIGEQEGHEHEDEERRDQHQRRASGRAGARARLALSGRPSAASIGVRAPTGAVASDMGPFDRGPQAKVRSAPALRNVAYWLSCQAWNLASTSSWLSAHH